ncbi:MAG: hypothetical protein LBF37_01460 [Rickettsiales bacterium]|jgi:hypothetical protein|nr:hypothetical protein [Rickettsiales bacterium]
MKKLALTSLVALFAVPAIASANVINDNPMYRPDAGQFYSITTIASHSENTNAWALGEQFGYGITDKLAVIVGTTLSQADTFDEAAWNDMSFGLNYRFFEQGNIKADLFGSYALGEIWGDHASFLDKDLTNYIWTLGARVGYVANDWTVAGHIAIDYVGAETFNWSDEIIHRVRLGLNGQYLINNDWNVAAGVEYAGITESWANDNGVWTGTVGVNYSIDANKYVGAFAGWEMEHATGDWEFEDGFTFGAKFGIQF